MMFFSGTGTIFFVIQTFSGLTSSESLSNYFNLALCFAFERGYTELRPLRQCAISKKGTVGTGPVPYKFVFLSFPSHL
jgi:hypothetical protein